MAMVASAIANDGVLEKPYFVEGVYNAQGERSFSATPKNLGSVMSSSSAKTITEMMEGVVNNGTGAGAKIQGVQVAGKTGTAETNKEYNDSWFVGLRTVRQPLGCRRCAHRRRRARHRRIGPGERACAEGVNFGTSSARPAVVGIK